MKLSSFTFIAIFSIIFSESANADVDYLSDFDKYPGGRCEFWKVFDVKQCISQREKAEKGIRDSVRIIVKDGKKNYLEHLKVVKKIKNRKMPMSHILKMHHMF